MENFRVLQNIMPRQHRTDMAGYQPEELDTLIGPPPIPYPSPEKGLDNEYVNRELYKLLDYLKQQGVDIDHELRKGSKGNVWGKGLEAYINSDDFGGDGSYQFLDMMRRRLRGDVSAGYPGGSPPYDGPDYVWGTAGPPSYREYFKKNP